jgi:hypothetical protein
MSPTDEKIIILLDLIIPRAEITKEILPQVARMKIYFEQLELMKAIDTSGVLLDEIYGVLNDAFYDAWNKIDEHLGSDSFKNNFSKLSPEGQDAYWSVDNDLSAIRSDYLPWRPFDN